jgi:hypothetical protein
MNQNKTLVLGASSNVSSYSNLAVQKLVKNNIETVAFGIKPGEIAGITIDNQLEPYQNIDTVTLYLSPKNQEMYYDYIVSLRPRRIIFNPGTENEELMSIAKKNNIEYEVACTLVLLDTHQY